MKETRPTISTGSDPMDRALLGGIPIGCLTLIEGPSGAGKSVLCQHLAFGALLADLRVAYYVDGSDAPGLTSQMASLSLEVDDFVEEGRLRIFSLETFGVGRRDPKRLIQSIRTHMEQQADQVDVIFVDSLTQAVARVKQGDSVGFFDSCKTLCTRGATTVIVLHSYALDKQLLGRCHNLFNTHLSLRIEGLDFGMRTKEMNVLEVSKVQNADRTRKNTIFFQVNPELGTSMNISLDVLPFFKFKA